MGDLNSSSNQSNLGVPHFQVSLRVDIRYIPLPESLATQGRTEPTRKNGRDRATESHKNTSRPRGAI